MGIRITKVGNEVGFIDYDQVHEVALVVKALGLRQDNYLNDEYYPPKDLDLETQVTYFMAMVAIDHRLSIPGQSYESSISGKRYSGADLLWRLGRLMLDKKPELFTADGLANVTPGFVKEWLGDIWDYGVRAFLLSDLGAKIKAKYNGSALAILRKSGLMLSGKDGFISLLKAFTAYSDPVEKKPYLLAKFLHGRGIARFSDVDKAHVPVDNHLTRIAIRLGIVGLNDEYLKMVKEGIPFTPSDDVNLRSLVRDAWKLVSIYSGVDVFSLDDYLWSFGRSTCIRGRPNCSACPFKEVCPSYRGNSFLNEHVFYATYWY